MPSRAGSRAIIRRPRLPAAAIDRALTPARERFLADWRWLWPSAGRVGLAVSGGSDSLALLVLAHAALPGDFEVATVDHGLRAEAADEAALVATVCARRGIAHQTLVLSLAGGTALQERARDARYAALAGWAREGGLAALVTAHHADDQAETLMMRLNRGAGVRGLAGMRGRSTVPGDTGLPLLRPLLGWRRDDLLAVAEGSGLTPADDPSNRDRRFERVRVRDGLRGADWIDARGLAATARHLADADAALDWAADRMAHTLERSGSGLAFCPDAPRAVLLRVLDRIAVELGGASPRGRDLARWLDALEAGGIATLAGVRGDARRRPWRFSPARPHRDAP